MITKLCLPAHIPGITDLHYKCHYGYLQRYAEIASIDVMLVETSTPLTWATLGGAPNFFSIEIDEGRQLVVDFSDLHSEGLHHFETYPVYGKYQYFNHQCSSHARLYPLGPPLDIQENLLLQRFLKLAEEPLLYTCNTDLVLNNQKPHTRALQRRTHVQQLLRKIVGPRHLDTRLTNQWFFWGKFKKCLVSVVVPGACNNMVDRGHLEQLALGVCTIAPPLWTVFPYWKTLEPWVHYIPCENDYSNLDVLLSWCRTHRNECRDIGKNAWKFFWDYCAPLPFWNWIDHILSERKET